MIKQVLILRKDLNMRKGKMIAQGAHAAIQAMQAAPPDWVSEWEKTGTTKIVVSVNSLEEFTEIWLKAGMLHDDNGWLPRALIQDAGLTEFKEPTFTAIGLGPAPAEMIDKITGELPLL